MAGRKPVPLHLRLIEGNPKKPVKALKKLVPSDDNKPRLPHRADKDVQTIWKRVIRTAPAGLLKAIDGELLYQWCVARALFDRAEASLRKINSLLVKTPNNHFIQNPLLGILNRQQEIMKSLASEMGFSPTSRARLGIDEQTPAAGDLDDEDE